MRFQEGDKWKITFCSRYDHFEYRVMLFGLLNILDSFQDYINKILAEKLDILIIMYLNNILI